MENVRTSLSSLLPEDTSNVVMNYLIRITDKKIRDKLDTWLESNFNEGKSISFKISRKTITSNKCFFFFFFISSSTIE